MTDTTIDATRSGRGARAALASGGVLSLGAALFGTLSPADAATFTVTNTADSGAGSLRQAILDANAAAGPDTVTFAGGLGAITLSSQINITDELTITGPATVSGGDSTRIFYIDVDGAVTITGLTLQDGSTGGSGGAVLATGDLDLTIQESTFTGNDSGEDGGALYFSGYQLTIEDSTFTGNTADYGGGGVNIHTDTDPLFLVARSTFSGNTAGQYGGGLAMRHVYDARIEDSTFSGNEANAGGGGVYWHAHSGAYLTVVNSTFSGNTANYGGGFWGYGGYIELTHSTFTANTANDAGGGIWLDEGEGSEAAVLDHLIVAGNTAPGDTVDLGGDTTANLLSNSLVGVTPAAGLVADGGNNEFGVDPLLGPLQDNGGPTFTHLPLDGSPAIDTGDPAFAGPPNTDQRGLPRVQGAAVEKGSVEVQAQVPDTTTTTTPPAAPPPVVADPTFTG